MGGAYFAVVAVCPLEVRCEAPLVVCKDSLDRLSSLHSQSVRTLKGDHFILGQRHIYAVLVEYKQWKREARDNAIVLKRTLWDFEQAQHLQ